MYSHFIRLDRFGKWSIRCQSDMFLKEWPQLLWHYSTDRRWWWWGGLFPWIWATGRVKDALWLARLGQRRLSSSPSGSLGTFSLRMLLLGPSPMLWEAWAAWRCHMSVFRGRPQLSPCAWRVSEEASRWFRLPAFWATGSHSHLPSWDPKHHRAETSHPAVPCPDSWATISQRQ